MSVCLSTKVPSSGTVISFFLFCFIVFERGQQPCVERMRCEIGSFSFVIGSFSGFGCSCGSISVFFFVEVC